MSEYLHWKTPLSLEEVFSKPSSPSYLSASNECLYWIESLSTEGGRSVLKCRDQNGAIQTITPKGYNVRTKANEYGGRAYLISNDYVYFCNYSDQRIYRQGLFEGATPVALTNECEKGEGVYFADICLTADKRFLVFVMETEHSIENITEIGVIEADKTNQTPCVLESGADFYASLSLSADGKSFAWVEWSHPNMPWDNTRCITADVELVNIGNNDTTLQLKNKKVVVENATAAHVSFLKDNSLILTIDWPNQSVTDVQNFANLYRCNVYEENAELLAVTEGFVEYSYPHWIFGNHRYAALNDNIIIAIGTTPKGDELHLIDSTSKEVNRVASEFCSFESVCVDNGVAYVIATSSTQVAQIVRIGLDGQIQYLDQAKPSPLSQSMLSEAQLIEFVSADNDLVYANFYPACNSDYEQPNHPAPLIVMVHGGPTARANSGFDILKQVWTSSGFAILDVNHRGSSGFGRRYRDALHGQWGEVDANDIRDAILFVIKQNLADANAIFIRGKSAGGYAVQRALTQFPELFKAGASYYGIGDLATLAEITHKFEAHYCDVLLGEVYDSKSAAKKSSMYFERSPIHFMGRIQCPMILFQGADDKVVPPTLSKQVSQVLEAQGIEYEYHLYDGEGHGFRKLNSQVDSLQREIAFFRSKLI